MKSNMEMYNRVYAKLEEAVEVAKMAARRTCSVWKARLEIGNTVIEIVPHCSYEHYRIVLINGKSIGDMLLVDLAFYLLGEETYFQGEKLPPLNLGSHLSSYLKEE